MAANIGYVWMVKFTDDYQYTDNLLPEIGSVVNLNNLNGLTPNTDDDLIFYGLKAIKIVVNDYNQKSTSSKCSQLELRNSISAYLTNVYGKECGIGSLKQYNFSKFDASKQYRILSYENLDENMMFILVQQIN